MAARGFDVTGVDFAPEAIATARGKAQDAGVDVEFVVDDLTRLTAVRGGFDVGVDYGTFADLGVRDRGAYVRQLVPRARPGAAFLLWCFEWELRLWERLAVGVLAFGNVALRPGEVHRWFAQDFDIEQIAGKTTLARWPRGWAVYLMTRR